MAHPAPSRMTYDAYLAAEATADVKHEYLRGEVFAMAGGTPTHARLAAAIIGELRNALADRPCEVFTSDLRVRIDATDLSTYPDVTVVCSDLQSSELDINATTNPILIVEVLSESTEAEQSVVNPITAPRAGIFGEGEEPKRSCTGRTASVSGRWRRTRTMSGSWPATYRFGWDQLIPSGPVARLPQTLVAQGPST